MSAEGYHVSSVLFTPEGVEIAFMKLPGDVRSEGLVMRTRTYAVRDNHPGHADEIAALREAVVELVADIDEDWPTAPVLDTSVDEDVDEEAGMGSG